MGGQASAARRQQRRFKKEREESEEAARKEDELRKAEQKLQDEKSQAQAQNQGRGLQRSQASRRSGFGTVLTRLNAGQSILG